MTTDSGAAAPLPIVHIDFDNGCYESTGAQPTTWARTDELVTRFQAAIASDGPHLILVPIGTGAGPAGPRATAHLTAPGIFERFTHAIGPLVPGPTT